uniref:LAGLIDADG endonuclease n=1 Tax=Parasitella parasitica TaxID=35722 RepID=A0A088S6W7_9FUNG|nr:LAGLIDADG endonuclease [Parasitella parasitica]AIO05739.1 LAGLIDADG endonuclease [Parasitella parasitica]
MNDGSKQGDGLHLNVYAFSPEDVDRLINVLSTKFALKCYIPLKMVNQEFMCLKNQKNY